LTFQQRWPHSKIEVRSESDLRRYVQTMCKNRLIDRYRHERIARQFIDYLTLNFSSVMPSQQDTLRRILLQEIIESLPKPCAHLLKLYITEELTPAEMAEREGASPATFYSRWYRCLEKAHTVFLQKKGQVNR